MDLNSRQQRALEAICDTFAPGAEGLPRGQRDRRAGRPCWRGSRSNPRESEQKQIAQLLGLWDTRLLTAFGGGGLHRFSELPQERRERVLLSWGDSRAAAAAGRVPGPAQGRAAGLYYMLAGARTARPARSGTRSAIRARSGAPENPPPQGASGRWSSTATPSSTATCASSAPAPAAAPPRGCSPRPAWTSSSLEAGGYYDDADFDGARATTGYDRMYLNGGGMATARPERRRCWPARCLGGGTLVNYTTSFRTPDDLRREWAGARRARVRRARTTTAASTPSASASASTRSTASPSARDESCSGASTQLGWHSDVDAAQRARLRRGEVCRLCHYGCQLGAKQSTLKTWLQDAHDAGARILVGTRADRVAHGGRRGARRRGAHGRRPPRDGALARRRRRLRRAAHPGAAAPLRPRRTRTRQAPAPAPGDRRSGACSTRRSGPGRARCTRPTPTSTGHGRRATASSTSTPPIPPSILLFRSRPWRGGREHAELMQALRTPAGSACCCATTTAARCASAATASRSCATSSRATTSSHMRRGVRGAAQILEAVGARRVFSSHSRWVAFEPGVRGDRDSFIRDADACGWGAGQAQIGSFHIMGSARMGGSPDDLGVRPARPGLGHARPLRLRRLGVPDRLRREPDGHDRGAGAHERAGLAARLT